jgi:hypothetical protein
MDNMNYKYEVKAKRNFTKFCTGYMNLACPHTVICGCVKKTQMPKGEGRLTIKIMVAMKIDDILKDVEKLVAVKTPDSEDNVRQYSTSGCTSKGCDESSCTSNGCSESGCLSRLFE